MMTNYRYQKTINIKDLGHIKDLSNKKRNKKLNQQRYV